MLRTLLLQSSGTAACTELAGCARFRTPRRWEEPRQADCGDGRPLSCALGLPWGLGSAPLVVVVAFLLSLGKGPELLSERVALGTARGCHKH